MLPPLSDERKQKICEMYTSGASYKEIKEATGCHSSTVQKVVKESGIMPRRTYTKKPNAERICRKCRKHISVDGARFCPFCGSDIRSAKQITAEGLRKVLVVICDMPMPTSLRDEYANTVRNAIKQLEEEPIE